MATELIVTEAFAHGGLRYHRGDAIADPEIIKAVEAEYPRHFVRRLRPEPVPAELTPPLRRTARSAS